MNINLSESLLTTILFALAHENNSQSKTVIYELEQQGVRIPVWIQRDILGR